CHRPSWHTANVGARHRHSGSTVPTIPCGTACISPASNRPDPTSCAATRSARRSARLGYHALVGKLAACLGALLERQPHPAQDMRRLGELDVAVVYHLEAVAPGVE